MHRIVSPGNAAPCIVVKPDFTNALQVMNRNAKTCAD